MTLVRPAKTATPYRQTVKWRGGFAGDHFRCDRTASSTRDRCTEGLQLERSVRDEARRRGMMHLHASLCALLTCAERIPDC